MRQTRASKREPLSKTCIARARFGACVCVLRCGPVLERRWRSRQTAYFAGVLRGAEKVPAPSVQGLLLWRAVSSVIWARVAGGASLSPDTIYRLRRRGTVYSTTILPNPGEPNRGGWICADFTAVGSASTSSRKVAGSSSSWRTMTKSIALSADSLIAAGVCCLSSAVAKPGMPPF